MSLTTAQILCMLAKFYIILENAPYTPTYTELREGVMQEAKAVLEQAIGHSIANMSEGELTAHFCDEVYTP